MPFNSGDWMPLSGDSQFDTILEQVYADIDRLFPPSFRKPHSSPSYAAQVQETVTDRGSTYGHPQENHDLTAILWTAWLRRRFKFGPGTQQVREKFQLSPEDVCMLNILQKCSRLAFGTKDDSWLDIAGYAENVAMLSKDQRNNGGG